MTDQGKPNVGDLVPAAQRDLASYAAANRLVVRGIADLTRGRVLNAVESIQVDLNDALFYYKRGNDWFDKQDYDRAIEDYNKAIRLDSKYAACYYNRGLAFLRTKAYEKAIKNYDEAIRLHPKNAAFYFFRGHAFCSTSMEWSVKKDYEKAISDCDKAISDYQDAIELNANNPSALNKACQQSQRFLKILLRLKALNDANEQRQHSQAICRELFQEKIDPVLKTLTYRERLIVTLRYGIGDGYAYAHDEIARILQMTPQEVSQIENKAVQKLQHPVRSRELQDFLDLVATMNLSLYQSPDHDVYRLVRPNLSPLFLRKGKPRDRMAPDPDPAFDGRFGTMDQLLAMSEQEKAAIAVDVLNMSTHSRDLMDRLDINSLGDLISRTADELLESKDFSMTCLTEVREKLRQFGLTLRGD